MLCATNQSSDDRQDQPYRGARCNGFVLDAGKRVRKGELLGSKRDPGFCLPLAEPLAVKRGGRGRGGLVRQAAVWQGMCWASGLAEEPGCAAGSSFLSKDWYL